jgi:hypothetical protein
MQIGTSNGSILLNPSWYEQKWKSAELWGLRGCLTPS